MGLLEGPFGPIEKRRVKHFFQVYQIATCKVPFAFDYLMCAKSNVPSTEHTLYLVKSFRFANKVYHFEAARPHTNLTNCRHNLSHKYLHTNYLNSKCIIGHTRQKSILMYFYVLFKRLLTMLHKLKN